MIGKKLGDRYELLERVGGGGMAVVYKAKDILLNRIVAVKILRSEFASDDDFIKRFRREAQSAASLSHPNIVNIYDIGVEEEIHFIVMEYIEGSTLKEYIKRHAPLPVEEAVRITIQIAEALVHAHHNHIIHRDIKPHNILIGQNGKAKVTDFGIARAVTSATITHTGSVLGSVHYFSPEQARGGMTGEKSDIYSLGVVLYEMVTGDLPFSGESPISVALKHLQESFVEPRQLNPDIPQSVENMITRALAKNVDKRYESAEELIDDLKSCLQTHRLAEPKLVLTAEEDEEATKEIPAIHEDMLDTLVLAPTSSDSQSNAFNDGRTEASTDDGTEEDGSNTGGVEESEQGDGEQKGRKRSKRTLWLWISLAVVTLFLLGFGAYKGYQFMNEIFYVQEIEVEDVLDLPFEEAVERLEAQGLQVGDMPEERHSPEVEEGHVMRQNPTEGSKVKEGTTVELTVSLGKEEVEMPSVVKLTEPNALRMLSNLDIPEENITIERENHAEVPAGHIISQAPLSGERVIPDETDVNLVISQGVEMFAMPDLRGLTAAQAESQLNRHNLILDKVEEEHSDAPEGEVIRQFPVEPGQQVEARTPITLFVSLGPGEEVRQKTSTITVTPLSGEETDEGEQSTQVEIYVQDANGERRVVHEEIRETKEYDIEVSVDRESEAIISVYKNEEKVETKEIPFED